MDYRVVLSVFVSCVQALRSAVPRFPSYPTRPLRPLGVRWFLSVPFVLSRTFRSLLLCSGGRVALLCLFPNEPHDLG